MHCERCCINVRTYHFTLTIDSFFRIENVTHDCRRMSHSPLLSATRSSLALHQLTTHRASSSFSFVHTIRLSDAHFVLDTAPPTATRTFQSRTSPRSVSSRPTSSFLRESFNCELFFRSYAFACSKVPMTSSTSSQAHATYKADRVKPIIPKAAAVEATGPMLKSSTSVSVITVQIHKISHFFYSMMRFKVSRVSEYSRCCPNRT